MRNLAETTNRDYAHCLALWLNFLSSRRCRWQDATRDDAEEFEFWRLTDPGEPGDGGHIDLHQGCRGVQEVLQRGRPGAIRG